MIRSKLAISTLAALALGALGVNSVAAELISKPGAYSGYSPALYDGYKMTSQYVTVRDGTKIAVDVVRPTLHGEVVTQPLPVVWMNSTYNRRRTDMNDLAADGAAMALVKYGYVIAVADVRGDFASFGKAVHPNRNEWMPWAYWDAYDITEWLAGQPWSNSKIGMWGCSATGHSQWQAAATASPHLKAIFPMSAPSEYYDWGGIVPTREDALAEKPASDKGAAPVDEDVDGKMLAAALQEHRDNIEPGYLPYRDSASPEAGKLLGRKDFKYWLEANTLTHLADINKSSVPAYETSNFGEDMRIKQGVWVKLHSIKSPMKMIMAPGNHCNWTSPYQANAGNPFDITQEELRWFDYWLKGVNNGVMDQPPIYYFTYNLPKDKAWKFAWQWPLPTAKNINYYFGPSSNEGAPSGVNNGSLGVTAPTASGAKDSYTVDYTVTRANQEEKGLTFTTPALAADTDLTGHPVVHLWISSTATDGDFLAYLADIGPDGKATPLPGTYDGQLRASHRALSTPPYDNMGLPYHRSFAQDVKPLTPRRPTELVFDMAPVSWVFKAGHRIRLIISCTATPRPDNPGSTPAASPAPVVSFYRDSAHRSYIALPVNGPLSASVRLVPGKAITAYVTFPKAVDRRYIKDVAPESITANGNRATGVTPKGNTLIARFSARDLKLGTPVTIQGRFGNKYDYGDLMTFTAVAAARR